mgnify:CR=1 FL=1
MSTRGTFSTYAVALVCKDASKWAPIVICMQDDEQNRLSKESPNQAARHLRKASGKNALESTPLFLKEQADGLDQPQLTMTEPPQERAKTLLSETAAEGTDKLFGNATDKDSKKATQKVSDSKHNLTEQFNNAHLAEAVSAYLLQVPLGTKVEGALKAERIPYVTVGSNKQRPTGAETDDNIQLLYSVERTSDSWVIREFTPTATPRPTRRTTVAFSESAASDMHLDPFDLDRTLLNRLYLLAGIAAGRRQIHERLAHILKAHDSHHRSAPLPHPGRVKSGFTRGARWLSAHLPQMVATSTVLSCGLAVALIWLKVWNCPDLVFTVVLYLFGVASVTGLGAFIQALRQKQGHTSEDKQIEEISEMAIEVRSELAQINLKVASGYACIDNTPLDARNALAPEGLLREIDDALHIKASFDSLDKVIATQMQNVSTDHKQKQEHRLHAYQNIVAAGSGVFTGFFTYEVGESVLKFIHATQFADDRSLQYWLFTKAGVSASLQGAGQSPAHAPVLPVVGEAHAAHGAEHATVTTAGSIQELDQLYHENFVHHELVGQAWLLTITIVVTWIAGYIGWHKPHDEHGGGHEHHG